MCRETGPFHLGLIQLTYPFLSSLLSVTGVVCLSLPTSLLVVPWPSPGHATTAIPLHPCLSCCMRVQAGLLSCQGGEQPDERCVLWPTLQKQHRDHQAWSEEVSFEKAQELRYRYPEHMASSHIWGKELNYKTFGH